MFIDDDHNDDDRYYNDCVWKFVVVDGLFFSLAM